MNVDDDSKEPLTDLRLSLDYSNQGTQLIENSGAGANATSRVDMAFVASDHLTELVWSPHKGLSIKCTNCSTAAEETRRALAMGMGNKATSAYQVNEATAVTAVTSAKSPGRNVRIGAACQSAYTPVINEGSRCNSSSSPKNVPELHVTPVKSTLENSTRKRSYHTIKKDKDLCLPEKTEQPQVGWASNNNYVNQQSNSAFKKQELNAGDDFVAVASNPIYSGFPNDAEYKHHGNDVSRVKGIYPGEDSPTESKINEYRRKGKAKVLSDANVGYGEKESRGSVESCSSVGSFCSQKKKRSLGQEFTNESKRIKRNIQPSPCPTSLVNGSSSFISWISNMTKGINKANKDGTHCLALTLTSARPQNENHERELITHRSNENHPLQRMGFQNIFQSIYRASSKVHEQTAFTEEHQKNGEPFDAWIRNNTVDVTPLSMHEMTSSSCKGDQSSGNGERQLKLQKVLSRIGDKTERISPEKGGASCNFLTKVQTIKLSSSRSSPDICRTQNIDSSPPPEIKGGLSNVMDPLQSFWVTRFYPKSPVPKSVADNHGQILRFDNQTKRLEKNIFRSSQVSKVVQCKGLLIEELDKLVGGQEDEASDSDASVGLKEDAVLNAQISEYNIDKNKSTERFKSSEAMASMFARRLDAIKHMSPAAIACNASGAGMTCFYCGKKGHNLQNCSEVSENELQGLLDIVGSPDSLRKTPCLCILCFQIGHWAVDCLSARSKVSVFEPLIISNSEVLETLGDTSNKEVLVENMDIPTADVPYNACNQNNPEPDPELHKLYAKSGPVNLELEESVTAPLPNLKDGQSSDILKGYFDAVRMIRLSRKEIIRLIDSQMPLSNVEGFFLRLRLGNMENGLGGTGYHVAYIDGVQSEVPCQGSKLILPVNVGSIKCSVGSESISNQDFLEDELMAWWSATVKNSNKFPTREELNKKLQQRNELGL